MPDLRAYKASIFQALGHPTRIAIVELLRDGELSAGVIQERLGIEQANVSQHLAVLRSRQILINRKEGNQVFYSLRSPVLVEVLDIMRRYLKTHLKDAVQMLGEIKAERTMTRRASRRERVPHCVERRTDSPGGWGDSPVIHGAPSVESRQDRL